MRSRVLVLTIAACVLGGCAGTTTSPASSGQAETLPPAKAPARRVGDTEVTFDSGGVTVHGSLRYPKRAGAVPAAVVLAGSGPTDRDGNSKVLPGDVGTLRFLAEQLETNGVATLRYDKLGTGKTGLGPFAAKPNDIDFDTYVQEARDALTFLAAQADIDAKHLMVVGHSEGGLIALVLSTDPQGAPSPSALALVNPLPMRYLDMVSQQLEPKADNATMGLARRSIDAVRNGTPLPALPAGLQSLFNPSVTKFLRQADAVDPLQLAPTMDPSVKILLTCADQDIQVPCDAVERLGASLPSGVATVTLDGTDHVLKETNRSDGTEYTQPLAYSETMKDALKQFVLNWTS